MNISVATYSYRHLINRGWTFEKIAGILKQLDIEYVEINNKFTTPERLPSDVQMFKDNGIKTILLTIDGNNYFQRWKGRRRKQFNFMKQWIDAADASDVRLIRANMGYHRNTSKFEKAFKKFRATFQPILEYCEEKGITHTFENHGSISSNVDFQIYVKEHLKSENYGYLVDTGNYKPKSDIYENIGKLGDSIKIVHAKMYEFDEVGDETKLDFRHIIEELRKIGYNGYLSIEYEGSLPDREGEEKSLELLKKVL